MNQSETRNHLLIVLSGPSGVGKDAVLAELRKACPNMHFTINATTRPPRPGEIDGEGHFFVGEKRFNKMVLQNELLEYALVYDHWYGVPKAQVQEALLRGQDVLTRVDIQGAASVRAQAPDAVLIFIAPPSLPELERRLRDRQTESDAQLSVRIESAREEMEQTEWFDHVIINQNNKIHIAVAQLLEIIEVERNRLPPRTINF